jgi:hypothetical protein
MATTTIKLTDETLKALGATATDAEVKILALLAADADAKTKLAESASQFEKLTASIGALDDRLKAVEGAAVKVPIVSAEDRKAIIEEAKKEAKATASSETAAIIAKAGVKALPAGAPQGTSTATNSDGEKPSVNRKAFAGLTPQQQGAFVRAGGVVID